MNWIAPNVDHVLEQRLRTARIELMEDPRIQNARQAKSTESINFLVQLIEDKIAAAARIGMDATEASLRHAAGNALFNAGVSVDQVRRTLEEAGRPLLEPRPMTSARVQRVGPSPLSLGGTLFLVWTVACLGVWLLLNFPPAWCVILVGAGGVPAIGLFAWREGKLATLKKETVGELPSRTVHYYMEQLRGAISAYERAVNEVLKSDARPEYATGLRTMAQPGASQAQR